MKFTLRVFDLIFISGGGGAGGGAKGKTAAKPVAICKCETTRYF